MGLDIIRFIEVRDKKTNTWKRLDWKKNKKDEYDESTFGFGRNMAEFWLDNENGSKFFHPGYPSDSQEEDKAVYDKWGYSPSYILASELSDKADMEEHLLHKELKDSLSQNNKIDEILRILKNEKTSDDDKSDEEEFYPEYEYSDYEINDKFDDKFAIGMLKIGILWNDYHYAMAIAEATLCDYISPENVRIIYIYNR